MDSMTQQDARMAEELMGAAGALQSQSEQMLAAISAFSMREAGRASDVRVAGPSYETAEVTPARRARAA
jgi:hypothetical protein